VCGACRNSTDAQMFEDIGFTTWCWHVARPWLPGEVGPGLPPRGLRRM